jgi:hypothetical protein
VKDFQKINWNIYNKPPYWQQWLCGEDTQKLASFGDRGLGEADGQILALKDEWDLDSATGYFLDRIGKLLDEKRNGNTDGHYRILLKLRRLLNTSNGAIPSIIKAIKFIYTSEIVHIVPDYPAGLIIEHDGEGTPGLNFNKLLAEIIPAGVSFSTKEIFDLMEEMRFFDKEKFVKDIAWRHKDIFTDTVFRNGRVLRDGTTVLDTQLAPLFRDGSVFRNGKITERSGSWREFAVGRIRTPIFRHGGIQDFLEIIQGDHASDQWTSAVYRNGAVRRDGSVARSRRNPHFNDSLFFDSIESAIGDYFRFADYQDAEVQPRLRDNIGRRYIRNGQHYRNGTIYRSSESVIDLLSIRGAGPVFVDSLKARLVRNGIAKRNGAEFRNGHAMRSMTDKIDAGYYLHHFRNGAYSRNGEILRNGMVYIPA